MGVIVLPKPRIFRKPSQGEAEIDWSHPMASALMLYVPMFEGAGSKVRDIAYPRTYAPNVPAWAVHVDGPVFLFDGSSTRINTGVTASDVCSAGAKTLTAFIIPNSEAASAAAPYQLPAILCASNGYFGLHIGETDSSNKVWAYNYSGGTQQVSCDYSAGVPQFVILTHDGTTLRIYNDGVEAGNVASGDSGNMSGDIDIGCKATGLSFDGLVGWVGIWDRVLSPSEILRLQDEPFCFLKPRVTRTWRSVDFPHRHPTKTIIRPRPRIVVKPQQSEGRLDLTNPITDGMVTALTAQEGAGYQLRDLTQKTPNVLTKSGAGDPEWVATEIGPGLKFNADCRLQTVNHELPGAEAADRISVMAWVVRTTNELHEYIFMHDVFLSPYRIEFTTNASGLCIRTTGGYTKHYAPSVIGKAHCVAGTFDGTTVRAYMNGVQFASSSHGGTLYNIAGAVATQICGYSTTYYSGIFVQGLVWNRCLSPAEIMKLHNDPFCFLQPRFRILGTSIDRRKCGLVVK